MTGTDVDLETQAQQLVDRGREALLERLRTAYSDAAAAHADLISLDDARIEAMVQAAAARADGLQWRRALASVAAEQLGMNPADALEHPAVVRAQSLVGAPSYEQSLAELISRPVPPPAPTAPTAPTVSDRGSAADLSHEPAQSPVIEGEIGGTDLAGVAADDAVENAVVEDAVVEDAVVEDAVVEPIEAGMPEPEPPEPQPPLPGTPAPEPHPEPLPEPLSEPSDELETVEADDVVFELLPEPDPIEYETEVYDVEAGFAQEDLPPAPVNPFTTQTAQEAAAAQELEDVSAPATAEHPHAGVAAAFAAVGASPPESSPQPTQPVMAEPEPPAEEAELTFPAVHLGGVANLPTKREGLSVRLSAEGLDIMQGPRDIIGRLVWEEIEALEVPHLRSRRRAKQARARLVVRTPHGDASFEVPEISAEELRERVEPFMRLHGGQ